MAPSEFKPGGNLGLRTRYFPAIDVDVDDPTIVAVIEDIAREILGTTARRSRSNSARCALLYRLNGEPFKKSALKFTTPDGRPAKIELLCDGQQLVVAGVHHSAAPLEWTDPQPCVAALASINAETSADFLAAVRDALRAAGCSFGAAGKTESRANGKTNGNGRAYALAMLEGVCGDIAGTPEGERNDVLNAKAYKLAQYVAGGSLDRAPVEAAIVRAAAACGLTDRETQATIRSAFGAGERNPRGAPEPRNRLAGTPAGASAHSAPLFLPVDDFFATCGEKVEYILEPYLPRDGFLVVDGPPKHGKTWFLGWLAGEIAAAGRTVLFVEEEGAKETLRARLQPFKRPGARIHVSWRKGWKLDDERSLDRLIEEIKAAGAHVLILDPLNQLHSHLRKIGDVPAEVILAIGRIQRETGCAVVLACHDRKGESWIKGSKAEAQSADIAGSYAWAASADNIIAIRAVPNGERRHGEVRFYVENPDTRNGEPFPRQLAVVKPGSFRPDAMTFGQTEAPMDATLRALLPLIPCLPDTITVEDLRKEAGLGTAKVRAAVAWGEEKGEILRKIGKKGGLYRIENGGQSAIDSQARTPAPVRVGGAE